MYFPFFITYMIAGFFVSLIAFAWGVKSGQFKDQKRARYLPLMDEKGVEETAVSKIHRIEAYALVLLVIAGLATSAAVLVFSLITRGPA